MCRATYKHPTGKDTRQEKSAPKKVVPEKIPIFAPTNPDPMRTDNATYDKRHDGNIRRATMRMMTCMCSRPSRV